MNRVAFLLGAGASKALGAQVKPTTPPLMCKLYDELSNAFPLKWGPNSGLEKYRDQFQADFEQTFTERVLGITRDYGLPGPSLSVLENQVPLALYFSRFVLDTNGADCYCELLKALHTAGNIPHTIFGLLNYECLFEQAVRKLGLNFSYDGRDAKLDTVQIAKLHGSCNFIARVGQSEKALLAATNVSVELQPTILQIDYLERALAEKLSERDVKYLPIMSQVSRYKEQFIAPAYIQQLRNAWDAGVRDAEFVAIIGVSFNSHDRHIIEPVEKASGTVLYIGDENSFEKWHPLNGRTEHLGKSFEDRVDGLLARLGIMK